MVQDPIKRVYPAVGKSDESLILYRYRSYSENSLESLKNNYLWMSSPLHFNDPFETVKTIDLQEKITELDLSPEIEQDYQETIEQSKILCLCKSNKNLLMWSYYADGLKGFVIGYDQHKLLESLASEAKDWKYQFNVEYVDSIPDVREAILECYHSDKACEKSTEDDPESDELRNAVNDKTFQLNKKLFATKNTAFQHEEEYRIVIQPRQTTKGTIYPKNQQYYAPDAVREIIFGEKMTTETDQIKLILGAIRERPDIKLYQAKRKPNSFELEIVPYTISEEKL